MLDNKLTEKIILAANLVSPEDLKTSREEAKKSKLDLEQYLIDHKLMGEEIFWNQVALYNKLPFVNLKDKTIRKDILEIIPEPIAQTHQIVAFDKINNELKIATINPLDIQTFEFIHKKTGLEIKIYLTTPSSLKEILKQYHTSLKAEVETLAEGQKKIGQNIDDQKKLEEIASDLPVIKIVDTLLDYAIFENASDIHIEPEEKEVVVRYRIDGILREVMTLPKKINSGIVARIKILSNLKLDEHRLPQDGRFKIATQEYKISFRVSIIPVFDGEKIVMRLLNESDKILTLEQLGFTNDALVKVVNNIKKPHGMILVTGPTGSGKTTTLYTVLNLLNKPGVNITTIEDPIEYHMSGVNQSQVNPRIGYTFASGLRAFLRQDPDIIMVGEIRDMETADIAINAAMTGHLVLSTLHTNDAATALPRLQDMNIPSFLIASTTNIIIAQRLVRKICQNCKTSYKLDKKTLAELKNQFNFEKNLEVLRTKGYFKEKTTELNNLNFYHGAGCKQCSQQGYKGRIGIYEVLPITTEIAELIMNKATADEIGQKAMSQGMLTILQDGILKTLQGITTLEEVIRVTKE